MGLNESKGDMYDFVTHTWNTVKGACPHGCSYCYMRRFGNQKPFHFDRRELRTNLGKGNFIFVGSSCDMFAAAIPGIFIKDTLEKCRTTDNSYLFQSKDPFGMSLLIDHMPRKSIVCTTIETNRWYPREMGFTPSPKTRAEDMEKLHRFPHYVTIEPIMDFDLADLIKLIRMCEPVQVNIGADTGRNGIPEPSARKILDLIEKLRKFTVVNQKRNLTRLLTDNP